MQATGSSIQDDFGLGKRRLVLAGILGLVAVLPYLPALGVGFFSDDYQWLGRMAPTVDRPSFVFTVFYRDFNPVLHASYLLDHLTGGPMAWRYHATSIVIHGLCCGLLFLFLVRLAGARRFLGARGLDLVAGMAALTWALNPRLSEAVIWPAARGHSLATLLCLAALLCLLSAWRYRLAPAIALFVLALGTKETALLPLALGPLLDRMVRDRPLTRGLWLSTGVLAVGFLAFNFLAKPSFHTTQAPVAETILKIPFILLRPLGLGDAYSFGWGMFLLVLLAFGLVAWLLRDTVAVAGFLWLGFCVLPLIPLAKLSSRYLYMPAVGYALILCGLVHWLVLHSRAGGLRRAVTVAGATLLAFIGTADIIWIQREIADYDLLSAPYTTCLESMRETVGALQPGETLVIYDTSPRDTQLELTRMLEGRGTIRKLIPNRANGVGGMIELPDVIEILRDPVRNVRAFAVSPDGPGPHRFAAYDGVTVRGLSDRAGADFPAERIFAARWAAP